MHLVNNDTIRQQGKIWLYLRLKLLIKNKLQTNIPLRILYVADAFRQGMKIDEIYQLCKIDKWFLEQIKEIVETENQIKNQSEHHER